MFFYPRNIVKWAGLIPDNFNAKEIQIASMKLDVMKIDKGKQKEYERYLENLRYKASIVDSSYGEGLSKGEEVGQKEGKRETAINMLKMGLGVDVISKVTGLGTAEIKRLQNE